MIFLLYQLNSTMYSLFLMCYIDGRGVGVVRLVMRNLGSVEIWIIGD